MECPTCGLSDLNCKCAKNPLVFSEGTFKDKPKRQEILEEATKLTCGERNESYGPPVKEYQRLARLWNAYLGSDNCKPYNRSIKAHDAAVMMALLKINRTVHNPEHMDSYVDGAAYLAIAGECVSES